MLGSSEQRAKEPLQRQTALSRQAQAIVPDMPGVSQAVILPEGIDELDPAVLGTLPPSLQLEFALKLRERKQAENREHFQKHTGKPTDFSSFQMQQYLKGSQLK